jgi:ectoine hydroxylase-related dioxygenase (phytanoyl-CoA dioxygenase family)
MNLPWIESPFFESALFDKKLNDEEIALCRDFNENGFVVIRNLISAENADAIVSAIDEYFPKEISFDTNRNQDLWNNVSSVKALALHPAILSSLKVLYGRESFPFQTLNFKYGSQQKIHSDCIHFSSIPERFMCGVWVALEDTNTKNGPLLYYPKSHKEPIYSYQDIGIPVDNPGDGDGLKKGGGYTNYDKYEEFIEKLIIAKGYEEKELHLKKGDVLIWSANLLHGGKKVLDVSQTRWSQVTHYYFDDCIYLTPMWSNMNTRELFLREPSNIKTAESVRIKLDGTTPKKLFAGNSRNFLSHKVDPSLLKDLSLNEFSVIVKDRIKRIFKKY